MLCLQEKDRAKFGPEYGDRFCMLQLVGRHEMDKVQLQHESESNHKLMVSWHGTLWACLLYEEGEQGGWAYSSCDCSPPAGMLDAFFCLWWLLVQLGGRLAAGTCTALGCFCIVGH